MKTRAYFIWRATDAVRVGCLEFTYGGVNYETGFPLGPLKPISQNQAHTSTTLINSTGFRLFSKLLLSLFPLPNGKVNVSRN